MADDQAAAGFPGDRRPVSFDTMDTRGQIDRLEQLEQAMAGSRETSAGEFKLLVQRLVVDHRQALDLIQSYATQRLHDQMCTLCFRIFTKDWIPGWEHMLWTQLVRHRAAPGVAVPSHAVSAHDLDLVGQLSIEADRWCHVPKTDQPTESETDLNIVAVPLVAWVGIHDHWLNQTKKISRSSFVPVKVPLTSSRT